MNRNALLKILMHAALGGAAVGLAAYDPAKAITAGNVLLPMAASAITSVLSLFTQPPAAAPAPSADAPK